MREVNILVHFGACVHYLDTVNVHHCRGYYTHILALSSIAMQVLLSRELHRI